MLLLIWFPIFRSSVVTALSKIRFEILPRVNDFFRAIQYLQMSKMTMPQGVFVEPAQAKQPALSKEFEFSGIHLINRGRHVKMSGLIGVVAKGLPTGKG